MSDPIASTGMMARVLGITEVHLGRLSKSGDLPAPVRRGEWDVVSTVQAFVAYKVGDRKVGEGSDAKSEELLLLQERRRKVSADADAQERENEVAKGNLIPTADAESVFFKLFRAARDAWQAWPGRFAPLIAADLDIDGAMLAEALKPYVHQQLSELGEPEPDWAGTGED